MTIRELPEYQRQYKQENRAEFKKWLTSSLTSEGIECVEKGFVEFEYGDTNLRFSLGSDKGLDIAVRPTEFVRIVSGAEGTHVIMMPEWVGREIENEGITLPFLLGTGATSKWLQQRREACRFVWFAKDRAKERSPVKNEYGIDRQRTPNQVSIRYGKGHAVAFKDLVRRELGRFGFEMRTLPSKPREVKFTRVLSDAMIGDNWGAIEEAISVKEGDTLILRSRGNGKLELEVGKGDLAPEQTLPTMQQITRVRDVVEGSWYWVGDKPSQAFKNGRTMYLDILGTGGSTPSPSVGAVLKKRKIVGPIPKP